MPLSSLDAADVPAATASLRGGRAVNTGHVAARTMCCDVEPDQIEPSGPRARLPYMVVFDPEVYPMDRAWLTGRASADHLRHQRPVYYHAMNANPHLRVMVSAAIRDDEVSRLYPRRHRSVRKGG